MAPYESTYKPECKQEGCHKPGPRNRWECVRANEAGWFLQKNGDMWCPDHTPEWVAEWRANKAEKNDG